MTLPDMEKTIHLFNLLKILKDLQETVVIIVLCGNMIGGFFCSVGTVDHADAVAGCLDHGDIIVCVADRGRIFDINIKVFT